MKRLFIEPLLKKLPVIPLFLFYICLQTGLLFVVKVPFTSDSLHYYQLAVQCIQHHSWYPAQHNLYDEYILAPLFINYLIFLLRMVHDPVIIHVSNLILNCSLALLTYFITNRLTHNAVRSKLALILYMGYLNSLGAVFLNLTELLFCLFMLICLILLSFKKPAALFVAGIISACAFNVRPIGILLILCGSVAVWIQKSSMDRKILLNTVFLSGFVMLFCCFGLISKITFGHFITHSTNGSVNILIGANENATGTFNSDVFLPGNRGYIADEDSVPYYIKNHIWRTEAIDWIVHHPGRWLMLIPVKLIYLYLWDDWALQPLLNSNQWNLYSAMKTILKDKQGDRFFSDSSPGFIVRFILLYIYHYCYYLMILFLGIRIMVRTFNAGIQTSGFLQQIIILFISSASGLVLLVYGAARYKYPMVLLMIILIAVSLSKSVMLREQRRLADSL
jgi:hypothetical protein